MLEGAEVIRPGVKSDGLDHLDRYHCVVIPTDITEVTQIYLDTIGEPGGRNPLPGQPLLPLGERDRADVGAACRRPDAQLSPPGADFQQLGSRADVRRIQKAINFLPLGVGKVRPRGRQAGEQCARVRHGLVEKLAEQIIGEVVVRLDVLPGLSPAALR